MREGRPELNGMTQGGPWRWSSDDLVAEVSKEGLGEGTLGAKKM